MFNDNQKIDEWTGLKKKLNQRKIRPYFKVREVWWASIGYNIGDEQNGKNQYFERPVLVIQRFYNNLLLALPLSTKIKDGNYYFRIKATKIDGDIIMSQGRVIDSKRLIRKVEMIDETIFNDILTRFKELL